MYSDRAARLLEMIDGFQPVDEVEAAHVRNLVKLLAESAAPFSRKHFTPGHVTASAFVVDPSTNRILLHHHRKLDRWLQLGGHVDKEEDVATAALREAREESGLRDVTLLDPHPFDIDVHEIPARKGEPPHLHFDVRFIVQTSTPGDATVAREESIDLAWLDFDEAERRMSAPESTRALKKIRGVVSRRS